MDFKSQSIGLEGVLNARELGGIRVPGGTVRHGLLLRGADLFKATDGDVDRLSSEFGVAKIFDFRISKEISRKPDRPVEGAANLWMPAFNEQSQILTDVCLPHEAYQDLGNWLVMHSSEEKVKVVGEMLYQVMVTDEFSQMQYAGFLQNILLTGGKAVYWHCSQGKDRTGLGAALLLAALGADRDTIMEDFLISNDYYRNDLEYYCSRVSTADEKEMVQTFVGVNPRLFSQALDTAESLGGGSLTGYLKGPLCFSESDMKELRSYYIE